MIKEKEHPKHIREGRRKYRMKGKRLQIRYFKDYLDALFHIDEIRPRAGRDSIIQISQNKKGYAIVILGPAGKKKLYEDGSIQ